MAHGRLTLLDVPVLVVGDEDEAPDDVVLVRMSKRSEIPVVRNTKSMSRSTWSTLAVYQTNQVDYGLYLLGSIRLLDLALLLIWEITKTAACRKCDWPSLATVGELYDAWCRSRQDDRGTYLDI